jgi:hypothetical protein
MKLPLKMPTLHNWTRTAEGGWYCYRCYLSIPGGNLPSLSGCNKNHRKQNKARKESAQ